MSNTVDEQRDPEAGRWKPYLVPALTAVYLTLALIACGWLLMDVFTGTLRWVTALGFQIPSAEEDRAFLELAMLATVGGAIGGITYGMINLQRHTVKATFRLPFVGDYIFRPFGSAALALIVFAMIRGGVLTVLGADATSASDSVASNLSSLGIGFLAGFGSYRVVEKLMDLVNSTFK